MGVNPVLVQHCAGLLLLLLLLVNVCGVHVEDDVSSHRAKLTVELKPTSGQSTDNHDYEIEHYFIGTYGYKSKRDIVEGHLVHVQSEDGVNHGCTDYNHGLPNHDWVALIERGQCMFTQKVQTATQRYNASAVIIYNNQASDGSFRIQSRVNNSVYVFLDQAAGRKLASFVDSQNTTVHVDISPFVSTSAAPFTFACGPFLFAVLTWFVFAVWAPGLCRL